MKTAQTLAALLQAPGRIIAAGVHDLLSAKLASEAGFELLEVGSHGFAASFLGLTDYYLTRPQMVDFVWRLTDQVGSAVLVDADDGYGDIANVEYSVRQFERAGASGIHIEDHIFGKHVEGVFGRRTIRSLPDMLDRIKAAVDARQDSSFQIVYRTDIGVLNGARRETFDVEAIIERSRAAVEAGADGILPIGVTGMLSARELEKMAADIPAPIYATNSARLDDEGAEYPGVKVVIYPGVGHVTAYTAMREAYRALRNGEKLPPIDAELARMDRLLGSEELTSLAGRFNLLGDG